MNKTYISLSFDDGREDFYRNAYIIMKKYNLLGTLNIVTGYIDGSWEPPKGWLSSQGPISIPQIREVHDYGIEIAFHGDKHIADKEDFIRGMQKLKKWGLPYQHIGFSYPNSIIPMDDKSFIEFSQSNNVLYIRGGRHPKYNNLSNKIAYICYKTLKFQRAYNCFNKYNIIDINNKRFDIHYLPSVVIKAGDKANAIINFIENNQNKWIILMFHSILEKSDKKYGKDSWYWDSNEFDALCNYLSENRNIVVKTVAQMINDII